MADGRLWIDGAWVQGEHLVEVRAPWDGRLIRRVAQASAAQVEQALAVASGARERLQRQSAGKRREVLEGIVAGLRARAEELAQSICDEAGKPITSARVEVRRAIEVFRLAAAELTRFGGSIVPVDLTEGTEGVECEVRRFPAGVVVGIVPFNFPLNLGVHKVAPALAVGAPIIVKPPPQAPSAQLLLAEIAQQAGAEGAAFQVVTCDNAVAERLATDPRVRILSFTGSATVGWSLKQKAPGRVLLELGGNSAALVGADADLDWAAERCVAAGFGYAGQVCIKVQRVLVEAPAHAAFVEKLLARTKAVPVGNPSDERTVCGPVIDDRSAARITEWVDEAVGGGARVLAGHRREGRMLQPTVLADVPAEAKAAREEIFGPVVAVWRVADWEEGLRAVNAGQYGLQAGVFTRDLERVRRAFHGLEVGGVIVNDAPSLRSDNMPYGGVKRSGLGREGVRYAMDEFTEERVLVTRNR